MYLLIIFYILQIYDSQHKRYEPPYPEIPVLNLDKSSKEEPPLVANYIIELSENNFGFAILRKSDNITMYAFIIYIINK